MVSALSYTKLVLRHATQSATKRILHQKIDCTFHYSGSYLLTLSLIVERKKNSPGR